MKKLSPTVLVDSREQQPLEIVAYPVEVVGLPCGDYGIKGFSDWNNPAFAVERKSLNDLIGSLTTGRDRFMREVEKLREFRFRCLLIEAVRGEVEMGQYRSAATPASILGSLAALQVRAGLHVIWAGSPEGAACELERLVRCFVHGVEKDYRRLCEQPEEVAV
jgi:ERCC4-type nuclease